MARKTGGKEKTLAIEREEFSDLSKLVKELKHESLKHLDLEAQAQTEFETIHSQMRSTRSTVGKLAQIMNDDIDELKDQWDIQFKEFKIETNQRFADVQNAVERLEFRLVHHLRDCQCVSDQVDRHQDGIASLKLQVSQSQVENEKYYENQKHLVQKVHFASLQAHDRANRMKDECSHQIEMLQERMAHFSKDLEQDIQEWMESTRTKLREMELSNAKQVENWMQMESKLEKVDSLQHLFQRHQRRFGELLKKSNQQTCTNENKWAQMESTSEAQKASTLHAIRAVEFRVKTKLDSLTQTLSMLTDILQTR